MPGIAIGKAFLLLKKYLCIENISEVKDTTCLNYCECREIDVFGYEETSFYKDQIQIDWNMYDANIGELTSSFGSHPLIAVQSGIKKSILSRSVIRYPNGI
jgi:hypothetical protein